MHNPLFTIIIPVFNSEFYLKQCIDSVICQTIKNIEIICVDDGSTDKSLVILEEYASKDRRIKVIQQSNLGAGAARNRGLTLAQGKYLVFIDSDDFFDLYLLEKVSKILKDDDSDVLVFSANRYDDKTKLVTPMPWSLDLKKCPDKRCFAPKEIKNYLFNAFQNWPWNKIYKKEFIIKENLSFQEIKRTNDMAFVCLALACANKISVYNEYLVYYRVNTGTSLQQTNDKSPLCFWEACLETRNRLIQKGLYELFRISFVNAVINGAIYNLRSVKTYNAYSKIYNIIHSDIEYEFDVSLLNKNEFYNKENYNEVLKIKRMELCEYLHEKMMYWSNVKKINIDASPNSNKKLIKALEYYYKNGFISTVKKILNLI